MTTTARSQAALHPHAFWDATWAWGFALIGCVFLAKLQPQRSRIGYLGLLALFALLPVEEEAQIHYRVVEQWSARQSGHIRL